MLLFHHARGLTDGVHAWADGLRAAGHVVRVPDLYEGRTFGDLGAGVAHAEEVGFGTILECGRRAAEPLPAGVVYAGLSLGVLPAQLLAQTRAGARGALLVHGCVPPEQLRSPWPDDVPVQIHMMDADPLTLPPNEELEAARRLDATMAGAQLFLYPGEGHLFTDAGGPDHDARAAALVTERVLAFLGEVG